MLAGDNMSENLAEKAYESDDITVYWNPELCEHAGECIRSNNEVFNVAKRPWVDLSKAPAGEIARIIDKCPSGALKYNFK